MTATRLVLFAVTATLLAGPGRALLVRARWTERIPRNAIVLWQALGAAVVVSLVGVCIEAVHLADQRTPTRRAVTDFNAHGIVATAPGGMTPGELFALTAALIVGTLTAGAILTRLISHAHARARQRMLIDLLGAEHPQLPGALVLPSPQAAAFSLPGVHSRIVVSTGAIATLADDELSAVLAHERAHVRARHDLVLLPFRALASLLPRSQTLARVRNEVGALVEMAADDRVMKDFEADALVRALCRLATTAAPEVALAATTSALPRRVERALVTAPRARLLAGATALSAAAVFTLPLATLLVPLGR